LHPVKSKNVVRGMLFVRIFLIATGLTIYCDVQQGDYKLLADINAFGKSAKDYV
jgi:hypothetical protein